MPFMQARVKFTNGDGRVVTDASNNLNVIKNIPLSEWIIRVEWCPVGSTVITNRANYELTESIRIPHNAYVNVYPILRSEKDLTETEYGLHLASFRFDDALINGRSIKNIGTNEIVGTWKFAPRNVLNILSLYTNAEPYGSSDLNVIFKQFYGSDIACTIVRETVSPLAQGDLSSDKLLVITSFSPTVTKFFFVAGDKFLVEKTVTSTNGNSVVTKTGAITVNATGWQALSDLAPVGFKESERTSTNVFACRYYIEPVQYAGDRYYSTGLSLDRISSVNFCKRLIFAASGLAPVGIRDQYASMLSWGEINPKTGVAELVIPATMDDISGLFDNAATLGPFMPNGAMPKIVTLGKIKKMSRTFHGAFNHGTALTYSPPENAVVFGEMDVSEVTDFSYCFGNCYQVNPDIENWNVSSATDMTAMFWIGTGLPVHWTRDLSGWCVSKITSQPVNFTLNHPMSTSRKPVWGSCPAIRSGLYEDAAGITRINGGYGLKYVVFYAKKSMAGKVLTLKGIGSADGSQRTHVTAQFHSGNVTPSRTDSFLLRRAENGGIDYPLLLTLPKTINTDNMKIVVAMSFNFQGVGSMFGGYNLILDGVVISEDSVRVVER